MLPRNGERPPPRTANDLSIELPTKALADNFNPTRPRSQAATRVPRERLRHLAQHLHRLGERSVYEFTREIIAGADIVQRLEVYARLDPSIVKYLGADRLPPEEAGWPIARLVRRRP